MSSSSTTKKRIAISTLAQLISQVLAGLFGVAVLKIMTSSLGVSIYGVYATALAFVSIFSLLTDLGVQTIAEREIAKRPNEANEIISHNMGLRLSLSLAIIPIISGVGLILYPHASVSLRLAILILSCYLIFDAIWATSGAYFIAKVRGDITSLISSLQQLLFLLFVVFVGLFGWGLFGFTTAYVFSIGIGSLAVFVAVRKHVPIWPRIDTTRWRGILNASIALGVISFINIIYFKADSVILSVLKGTTVVGLYTVAYSLVNVFAYLPGYFMGALIPSMATSEKEDLRQIVNKAFHIMVTVACIIPIVSWAVSHNVVIVVSSKAFSASATPFTILAFSLVFSYISRVFSSASIAVNKHHKMIYISTAALLLNVVMNLATIPRFGILGAAWSTVASELFALILIYRLFRKETGIQVEPSVAVKPILSALVTLALGFVLKSIWSTGNVLLNTLIAGTAVTVIYFALLYVSKGLPDEFKAFIDKGSVILVGRIKAMLTN